MYPSKKIFLEYQPRRENVKPCKTSYRKTYNDENADIWEILGNITKSAHVIARKSRWQRRWK